jgi:hypothetical protein
MDQIHIFLKARKELLDLLDLANHPSLEIGYILGI